MFAVEWVAALVTAPAGGRGAQSVAEALDGGLTSPPIDILARDRVRGDWLVLD